jgi:NAD(P)H-flavin reductase
MVDVERLKRSWAHVAGYGDQVPLRFYSRLFVAAPQTRELFPLSMVAQRDRLVTALGHTVSNVDNLDRLVPYLQQLGRDHRRFGAVAEHYGPVGDALLATLADFLGKEWTPDLAQDWAEAYALVARTMTDAADQAARYTPPWWSAEVIGHERRTFDIAIVTVQPDQAYDFVPGQSLAVETVFRPRIWRYYSPANAPRDDGSIELHVRRVPGGQVSGALVDLVQKGDLVHLGAPIGFRLTLAPDGDPDLLLVASGTGLAPLKAVVEQVAAGPVVAGRQVSLFVGARTKRELYDVDGLRELEARHPWLTVTPVLSDQDELGAIAVGTDSWRGRDVYICGNDEVVASTVQLLHESGCPPERVHFEGFQGLGGQTYGPVADPRVAVFPVIPRARAEGGQ